MASAMPMATRPSKTISGDTTIRAARGSLDKVVKRDRLALRGLYAVA